MNNANVPLSSNAVLQQDTWADDNSQNNSLAGGNNNLGNGMGSRGGHHSQGPGSHYKVGSKLKLGAATSTNFMKNVNQPNSFNMSMLRSVQQNMPNVSPLPSLLTLQSFDLSYFSILFLALLLSLRTLFPSMALIFENLTVWQMPFRWQISHRVLGMHS